MGSETAYVITVSVASMFTLSIVAMCLLYKMGQNKQAMTTGKEGISK